MLSDEVAEILAPLFKGEAPLSVNTRIFLDGHQDATLSSPAASGELTDKETVAIEWQGMQGNVWQSAARDKATFNVKLPGMVISPVKTEPTQQATPEAISFSDMQYQADLYKGKSGMWHGKAKATIASIDVNVAGEAAEALAMHIDTIEMHGEQSESNGLIQASGVMKSKQISVNGFELTNATYDAAVENIDAKAMQAWQITAQKMMKNDSITADPFAPMAEHLPALFNAHPIIRINDISVDSPMGKFAIKLNASIIGEWNDMLMENPAMFATLVKADLDASVPRTIVASALQDNIRKAIIAQAIANNVELSEEELDGVVTKSVSQQLEGLIGQGYIKANDDQLESRMEYNAGVLTINGMDASPLIGAIMQ